MRARTAMVVMGAALLAAVPATAMADEVPPLPAGVIAPGVSIDGLPVAGMTRAAATEAVLAQRVAPMRAPLVVTFRGRRLSIDPVRAGYRANVDYAVSAALLYGRSQPVTTVNVQLPQQVNTARIRAIVAAKSARVALPARDATLSFRGAQPLVRKARIGLSVDQAKAVGLVKTALLTRSFPSYALPATRVAPAVTSIGSVVVVNRETLQLKLYHGATLGARLPSGHRAGGLPDPDRPLQHHREAGRPHLVPAQLALGRRARSHPARRQQPARHTVDGHVGAGDRHPRHAGHQQHRHARLARLHPHVHPRRRDPLPPGRDRHPGHHRLSAIRPRR